jgi:hypothetical protein
VSTPSPPDRLLYHVPALGYRIIISGLLLVPAIVLLVGFPVAALAFLQTHNIALPIPIATVALFGFAIAILIAARYVAKPTRLFGPLSIATSVVGLLYLVVLYFQATYQFSLPNANASIAITYLRLIELLMLVPAFTIAAGVVTTVEDFRAPTERLPFDFPA